MYFFLLTLKNDDIFNIKFLQRRKQEENIIPSVLEDYQAI